VDIQRQRVRLPTEDANQRIVDALILFPSGTPMKDHCPARSLAIKP
jgi:hypothetical protein